eukprot:m51a1_g2723 putative myotubularin-related protein 2 (908) ;mRNA; r:859368-862732
MFFWQPRSFLDLPASVAERLMRVGDPQLLLQGEDFVVEAPARSARAAQRGTRVTVRSLYDLELGARYVSLAEAVSLRRVSHCEVALADMSEFAQRGEVRAELQAMSGELLQCVKHVTTGDRVGHLYLTNFRAVFVATGVAPAAPQATTPIRGDVSLMQMPSEAVLSSALVAPLQQSVAPPRSQPLHQAQPQAPPVHSPAVREFPLGLVVKVVAGGQPSRAMEYLNLFGGQEKADECSLEIFLSPYYPSPFPTSLKFTFETPALCREMVEVIKRLAFPEIQNAFAFSHVPQPLSPAVKARIDAVLAEVEDVLADYRRMGLDLNTSQCAWRTTQTNRDYTLAPTYPPVLVIPRSFLDKELFEAAKFRGKGRVPVLSWVHPSGASLTRGSQPLVGFPSSRSTKDEALLEAIRLANSDAKDLYILDSRPYTNGVVNMALGGGYEKSSYYQRCNLEFLNMPNIHIVRDSYLRLRDACLAARSKSITSTCAWLQMIGSSGWFDYLRLILAGTARIVDLMDEKNCSVFIHCSDAWDRTAQLASLAEICMDPYYRTLRGFILLIEKEWLRLGHKFTDRLRENSTTYEASPVFLQFLECVWQLMKQNFGLFEFNEDLLIVIIEEALLGRYGTFLCNNHKERCDNSLPGSAPSLWAQILSAPRAFLNPFYRPPTVRNAQALDSSSMSAETLRSPPQSSGRKYLRQSREVITPRPPPTRFRAPPSVPIVIRPCVRTPLVGSELTTLLTLLLAPASQFDPQAVQFWKGFWGRFSGVVEVSQEALTQAMLGGGAQDREVFEFSLDTSILGAQALSQPDCHSLDPADSSPAPDTEEAASTFPDLAQYCGDTSGTDPFTPGERQECAARAPDSSPVPMMGDLHTAVAYDDYDPNSVDGKRGWILTPDRWVECSHDYCDPKPL